jgi:hypothetical protein
VCGGVCGCVCVVPCTRGTLGDVVACDDGAAASLDVGDHDGTVGSSGQLVVERTLELFFV